jgi:alpha-beta hydrolase superfamily lysophospholipase
MIAWRCERKYGMWLCAAVLVALAANKVRAQQPAPPTTAATKRAAPQEIAPKSRDNVQLAATYYPPTKPGKDVVPVILLHGHKGSRADMQGLAEKLQDAGHAAIAIDLRGHGGSTRQMMPAGKNRDIDPAHLTKQDLMNMVKYDVESAKAYLMERNNAGEVNIDKLCVVGAELGAVVAANWAVIDWSWPPLATGKQGQDVKAIVMLSPPKTVRGLNIMPALTKREIASKLSWLVVYGEKESDAKDAKTATGQLEKWLPKPPAEEAREKQALFVMPLDTNLQGAKLLAEGAFQVAPSIMQFIDLRLVKKTHPWMNRKALP